MDSRIIKSSDTKIVVGAGQKQEILLNIKATERKETVVLKMDERSDMNIICLNYLSKPDPRCCLESQSSQVDSCHL